MLVSPPPLFLVQVGWELQVLPIQGADTSGEEAASSVHGSAEEPVVCREARASRSILDESWRNEMAGKFGLF